MRRATNRFDATGTYRMMARMRLVEDAIVRAWDEGLVPGEYHSGIGEEGINAGVLTHLGADDSVSLDHRNTAGFIGRGTDPADLMLEVFGSDQGMNAGMAGHMHLLDPDVRAACDGMVGASGPLAVGNAVAHLRQRPGAVAVAFHGEAAMNQGMLMESYNMAVAWNLPVLFVCKDNKWSITTYSADVTGGDVVERAASFGLATARVKGHRVQDVHRAAGRLIDRARRGGGPGFLYATCFRPGGHFEGDPIVRLIDDPAGQAAALGPGIRSGATAAGGSRGDRLGALKDLTTVAVRAKRDWSLQRRKDPVRRARTLLPPEVADRIDAEQATVVREADRRARAAVAGRPTFGLSGATA
ncbi:thiamine pyrophosphate-dependent dehydrogenase E1 component subunit alpha [Gordonia sp. VNK21]|uniref:thiamine pyrophosphate-dependent dehydrogenase E1 component subunit alpha n=1 Tax=Gordonia sp. VNK21 TaxID=3382483 RepID=UPI0038D3AD32